MARLEGAGRVMDRLSSATGRAATRGTAVAVSVGSVITLAVATLPSLHLAYRSPDGHLVTETAVAMIAALVAVLVHGRFRRRGTLQELLLVHAFGLLALTALFFVALPVVAGASSTSAITTWAPLVSRLAGGALLLAAALVPERRPASGVRPGRQAAVVLLGLGVLAGLVQLLAGWLPEAVTAQPPPEDSEGPRLEDHPVVLAVQVLNLLCYAGATAAFVGQVRRTGDALTGWLAIASALGALARVNYLLFPSLYSEWLYTGDLFRLASYVALLAGALREIGAYWRAQSDLAVHAERRRLARDLHDGAVQELGYIHRLAGGPGLEPAVAGDIRAAALRATDEARRTISALTAPADEPPGDAVRRAVAEIGARYGVSVEVDDQLGGEPLPMDHLEALVRIAREAASNAARHASPSRVSVDLRRGSMVVEDDGRGFDPDAAPASRAGHFGLTSMRDRAEGMGGHLVIESAPGRGTRVEVTW